LWDDPAQYEQLSEAARAHSRRDDMRPDLLAQRFEEEMERVVQAFKR
jgi:hypothetical protein